MKPDAICAYCLDEADGYDHLVPVSRQTTRRRRGKMASVSERVPCCSMCNSLLGNSPAFTFRDRSAVLLLRYAERPRSEARDTWRKIQNLFRIVAGFELEAEIEAIDERQRERLRGELEMERARRNAEDEARAAQAAYRQERIAIAKQEAKERIARAKKRGAEKFRKAYAKRRQMDDVASLPEYLQELNAKAAELLGMSNNPPLGSKKAAMIGRQLGRDIAAWRNKLEK
jgi:hypothetical protein